METYTNNAVNSNAANSFSPSLHRDAVRNSYIVSVAEHSATTIINNMNSIIDDAIDWFDKKEYYSDEPIDRSKAHEKYDDTMRMLQIIYNMKDNLILEMPRNCFLNDGEYMRPAIAGEIKAIHNKVEEARISNENRLNDKFWKFMKSNELKEALHSKSKRSAKSSKTKA